MTGDKDIFGIVAELIRLGATVLVPSQEEIIREQIIKLENLKKKLESTEKEEDVVLKMIQEAKEKLKSATKYERCSICKERLKEAQMYLDEELEVVERAHKIAKAMEKLKLKGVISHNKDWNDLTPKEKSIVYKEAGLDGGKS